MKDGWNRPRIEGENLENRTQRTYMKTFMKTATIGALALAMATFGTATAKAGPGWPIAAGVVGGLAVGTAVGATIAAANATPVYTYPYPAYPAYPGYAGYPAPAPAVVAPGPQAQVMVAPPAPVAPVVVAGPSVVVGAPWGYYSHRYVYGGPYAWGRWGWGYRGGWGYGGHGWRR